MNAEEKTAWIDEENKIVSFHAIDNAKMVMKAESLFWDFLFGLTNSGYRVMGRGDRFGMKRIPVLLLAATLCLWLAACSKKPEPEPISPDINTEATDIKEKIE